MHGGAVISEAVRLMRAAKREARWAAHIAAVDAAWILPAEGDKRIRCPSCGVERWSHKYEKTKRAGRCPPCAVRANSAQSRASSAVNAAIRRGEIKPAVEFACVDCGVQAREYDHRDYAQMLVVDPVCTRCNSLRGPAAPFNKFAA